MSGRAVCIVLRDQEEKGEKQREKKESAKILRS